MSKKNVEVTSYAWDFMTPAIPADASPSVTMDDLQAYADEINTGKHMLYLEHRHPISDPGQEPYVVGHLKSARVDLAKSTIEVSARLDDNARGKEIKRAIEARELNGFSLGINHKMLPDSDSVKYKKQFVECSIVAKPRHDAAQITGVHEVMVFSAQTVDAATKQAQENLWARLRQLDSAKSEMQITEEEEIEKTISPTPQSLPAATESKDSDKMSATTADVLTLLQKIVQNNMAGVATAPVPVAAERAPVPVQEAMQTDEDLDMFHQFQQFKKAQAAAKSKQPAAKVEQPAAEPVASPTAATPVAAQPTINEEMIARLVEEQLNKRKAEDARARAKPSETKAAPAPKKAAMSKFDEVQDQIETLKQFASSDTVSEFEQRLERIKEISEALAAKRADANVLQTQPDLDEAELQRVVQERAELEKAYHEAGTKWVQDVRNDLSRQFTAQGKNMPDKITTDLIGLEQSNHMPVSALERAMILHHGVSASSALSRTTIDQIVDTQKKLAMDYAKTIQKEKEDREIAKTRNERSAAQHLEKLDTKTRVGMNLEAESAQAQMKHEVAKQTVADSLAALAENLAVELNLERFNARTGVVLGKTDKFAGYDSVTGRPVAKEGRELTFSEATGIPWELANPKVPIGIAAKERGMPAGFRQKQTFKSVKDAGIGDAGDGYIPTLNNVFSTGNAQFIGLLSECDVAPETGRPLMVESELLKKKVHSNKWDVEDVAYGDTGRVQVFDMLRKRGAY
jgi:hypothetical protein